MTYDPTTFWEAHGPALAPPGAATPEHVRQEAAIVRLLERLDWQSVFEVGIGGGRITSLIRSVRPDATYTGLDVGTAQMEAGRRVWPDGEFIQALVEDFDPGDRQWDLVIVSEVLMHVVPNAIERACDTLLRMARRHLVAVEWVPMAEEYAQPIAPWNFPHDYLTLFGPVAHAERVDRQVLFHVNRLDYAAENA